VDPFAVMLVATLLIAPASSGNVVLKDVSSWSVDMDWTEIIPGVEMMMKGVFHNVSLLFSTSDPSTFRLVEMSSFHGALGVRMYNPMLGFVSLFTEDKVVHARFVGDVVLDETGLPVSMDGILAVRSVGSVTLAMDDVTLTESVNVLALIKVRDGGIEWARIGVPMGWPFQLLLAQ